MSAALSDYSKGALINDIKCSLSGTPLPIHIALFEEYGSKYSLSETPPEIHIVLFECHGF